VTPGIILLHGLDDFGEDPPVVANDDVGQGLPLNDLWLGSDDVHPGRANPPDRSIQVQVHDDIEGLFSNLAELVSLFSYALAH
jgi:hypothetical protein